MKNIGKSFAFWLTLLTGLGLIFIGAHFLIAPLSAEAGFGIHVDTRGDYSFHYIKGIRDLFSGLAITMLLLVKEFRALGILMTCGIVIPATDFIIVVIQPNYEVSKLYPHISAILILIALGIYYPRSTLPQKNYKNI